MKKVLMSIFFVLGVVVIVLIGYVCYLFIDYDRISDNQVLEIKNNSSEVVKTNKEYSIISYNIGFCAYTPEFGFFMDGGTESRASSKESVNNVLDGITSLLEKENADFLMLEEVDVSSTRTYHINQKEIIENKLNNYSSAFAVNYDSSYLFYPFTSPHGKSYAGLMTLSKYVIKSSIRRSLPIETGIMKFFDLDRCYTISRLEMENGKELVLFTLHLSAYTSDGTIATEQLHMLLDDMKKETNNGNYVICGGDFNKDLLGNSSEYFGIDGKDYTWAQSFPFELLDNSQFSLVAPLDINNPVASCRNADGPYNSSQFVITIDGFIVSSNVEVISSSVIDTGFKYSDHNPVKMNFILK